MALQTLRLLDGVTQFLVLYSGAESWDEANLTLVDMPDFDDINNIEIETVPALFGGGSYVVSKRLAERNFQVKGNIKTASTRLTRDFIASKAKALEPITVQLTRSAGTYSMEAYITSLLWEQTDEDSASFTIGLKSLSPFKNLGGSTIL